IARTHDAVRIERCFELFDQPAPRWLTRLHEWIFPADLQVHAPELGPFADEILADARDRAPRLRIGVTGPVVLAVSPPHVVVMQGKRRIGPGDQSLDADRARAVGGEEIALPDLDALDLRGVAAINLLGALVALDRAAVRHHGMQPVDPPAVRR